MYLEWDHVAAPDVKARWSIAAYYATAAEYEAAVAADEPDVIEVVTT